MCLKTGTILLQYTVQYNLTIHSFGKSQRKILRKNMD